MKNKSIFMSLLLMSILFVSLLGVSSKVVSAETTKDEIYLQVNNTNLEFNKIIYVDETNGDDTNGDGSKENPFKTFNVAYSYITDDNNEAIYLQEGTYTISVSDTELKIMSIIGKGKDTILYVNGNLRRISNSNSSSDSVMYDISNLKFYRLIFKSDKINAANNFFAYNTHFYNVVFNISAIPRYSIFSTAYAPSRPMYFYNCTDITGTYGMERGYAIIQNCYGLFKIGYSTNEANIQRDTSLTESADVDENYNILSTGWKNAGTGTNPDGSVANIGVYGGEFAWDYTDSVDTPLGLKAVANDEDKQIEISWDAVAIATSYHIKRSTISGGSYKTVATSSAITFTDIDVIPGTTYYYVVSAVISDTESTNSNEVSATITVTPLPTALKVVLEVDEELQLSVDDDLNVNTEMSWTSSDETVATINRKGVVTALKPGNTVITVTSVDGTYTDYINILVVDNADDFRLAVDLKVGKACRLTVDDLTDTVKVTWTSIDPTVATISSKGKVSAVSKGLTLVTATDEAGNEIGQIYIRVRE